MISQQEYQQRRQHLMQQMGEKSIAIIAAAPEYLRNNDAHYRYRQNSDFYYLTGFSEPEAVAVLIPGNNSGEYILFNRQRNPEQELWTGRRVGQEAAITDYAATQSFAIEQLEMKLPELLQQRRRIYYAVGREKNLDNLILHSIDRLRGMVRTGINAPDTFINIEHLIHEMRLRKSHAEIELMRKAAQISVAAHNRAMRACKTAQYEYELEAELLYEFHRGGCTAPAYTSIVGGGENSCILHYTENNKILANGDLVLIDAAGEYQNYAADITRTFPFNGKFSAEQKAIYNLVLEAQSAGIAQIKPGNPWNQVQEVIVNIITQGLVDLGILKGDVKTLIESKAYRAFYMHNSGHWLGLDVHDVGHYKTGDTWRLLEVGNVLTVEPGVYIAANNAEVDKKWWNIGVRIEDDVLVTEDGYDILSKDLPKTVEAIEALMAAG